MSGPLPARLLCGAMAAAAVCAAAVPRRPHPARRLPPPGGAHDPGRRKTSHVVWRRAGLAVVSLVALLIAPPLALVPPVAAAVRARLVTVRGTRRRQREIAEALPDAVDLLLLCTEAGWSLPVAHPQVARRVRDPVGAVLRAADDAADRGQPRADALVAALTPLGERARVLAHVLADHLHYGVPLAPGLDRLGLELRLDRRRRAELAARRVPVRLLGPLVACILPAFALLTVVPLLAASLRALPT